jgi:acyl-CoA dehydrogenase
MQGTAAERIYREVKVMTIGGGTEEIMNELASRQLGLQAPATAPPAAAAR